MKGRIRIRIRINVINWIRIRIKVISWIRISIKVISWIRIRIKVISWIRIRIRINLQISQNVWKINLFEHFFKVFSLYLEVRIRIRIEVKGRIHTVRKMDLILRSIERMLQTQLSMARRFKLHVLRRYNVKFYKMRNFTLETLRLDKLKSTGGRRTNISWICSP